MMARRETRWDHVRDTLRFVVRPSWKLLPLLLGLALVGYLLVEQARVRSTRPIVTNEGRIDRFGVKVDPRVYTPSVVAVVRFADGTTSEVYGRPNQMARCRVGGLIRWTRGPQGTRIDRCGP